MDGTSRIPAGRTTATAKRPVRVLFLCTGNSCRSQMAEAFLRHAGGRHFEAFSAGSHPAGYIHALALDTLSILGIPPAEDAYSKSFDAVRGSEYDAVITLCDEAAGVPCPLWDGAPLKAHWSLPDPTFHPGTPEERLEFSLTIARRLLAKIQGLTTLDWCGERAALQAALHQLGEI